MVTMFHKRKQLSDADAAALCAEAQGDTIALLRTAMVGTDPNEIVRELIEAVDTIPEAHLRVILTTMALVQGRLLAMDAIDHAKMAEVHEWLG